MKEPSQADLIRKRLLNIRMRLYASQAYLDHHGTPSGLDDLARHRVICQNPTAHQVAAGAHMARLILSHEIGSTLSVNNYFGVLQAVLHDIGIGILPDYLCGDFPQLVRTL